MIIQYYKGALNIAKVVIEGTTVTISDSNLVRNGIRVEQILARDEKKLKEWKNRIKDMTEKEIADELRKDLKRDNGLLLSSQEVRNE